MPPRQMRLRYAILLLTLLSCTDKQRGGTKTLDFGEFKIDVPSTWQPVRAKGIDSYVGLMTLDHGDTVSFDLGWYSNPLEEEYKFMVENGDLYLKKENESTSNSAFFEFYGKADTVDIEKFKVNNVTWTTIDGKRAKLIQPKNIGTGMTGIYFDSLWVAGSGTDRFQMNGKDLHPDNERQLLKAFETLKFIKK
ncbi:MAG: hypothetical protein KF763_20960 [Cyclobacteriaceae bacterium]|nr:hypothetical protein [Cyclobacteriaceae bacterium]